MTEVGGKRLREWLDEVPVTVTVVAALSGWLVLNGVNGYPQGLSSLPFHLDPLYYVGTLFAHDGVSHYLSNMYFFVPAGLFLTYLTSNRKVLYVVLVSHLPTALICSVLGLTVVGAGAAAYGLLAAMLVRATWFCSEGFSGAGRVVPSIAVVVLAGVALVVATGGALIAYVIPVSGFVLGGTYEVHQILRRFKRKEVDETDSSPGKIIKAPDFTSRWENMAKGDPEEAEKLEEKYSDVEAAPDDTHAGSRGRRREG